MRTALLLGILVGLAAGLVYAWLIDPVELTTADLQHVDAPYREAWLIMSAEAYAQGGDWDRTRRRLDGLSDPNLKQTVATLFDRLNADGPNAPARALARLYAQLDKPTAPMLVYLVTPVVTPTPRPTPPAASPTPRLVGPTATFSFPTPTPTSTPTPEFEVASGDRRCESGAPQIRVTVQDLQGNGLPGVDVWITWDGGADRFVTGLKPEFGAGYGDFDMQLGISYRVGAGTQSALALVSNLRADDCPNGRLSWNVVLRPIAP